MRRYLQATERDDIASYAESMRHDLGADADSEYERVIEIVSSRPTGLSARQTLY
jgi:hypothetical protein